MDSWAEFFNKLDQLTSRRVPALGDPRTPRHRSSRPTRWADPQIKAACKEGSNKMIVNFIFYDFYIHAIVIVTDHSMRDGNAVSEAREPYE